MALFGRQAQQRGASRYLVEFKAGKLTQAKPPGKTVTADPRKGMIYISKGDDDLVHFCWKERSGTSPEDDLIIFPNDVEFKKVPQCTTGRVFVLKFKGSSRRLFYWMQEPDASKDEESFKKIIDYLAGMAPPRSVAGGADGGLPADLQALGIDESTLQDMLGGIDRNQLLQMLGVGGGSGGGGGNLLQNIRSTRAETVAGIPATGNGGSARQATGTAAPRPAAPRPGAAAGASKGNAGGGKIQLSDLRHILGSVAVPPEQTPPSLDFASVINKTLLLPILSDPAFVERLVPHLPQDPLVPHTVQEVLSTMQSPQFQQAIQAFTSAFETRQLGPLIQEFNLGPQAVQAAEAGDFRAFVKALEKNKEVGQSSGGESKAPTGGDDKKKNDDDDEMSVD